MFYHDCICLFYQAGSATMRGESKPHTVPLVTTNLDSSYLKWVAIFGLTDILDSIVILLWHYDASKIYLNTGVLEWAWEGGGVLKNLIPFYWILTPNCRNYCFAQFFQILSMAFNRIINSTVLLEVVCSLKVKISNIYGQAFICLWKTL